MSRYVGRLREQSALSHFSFHQRNRTHLMAASPRTAAAIAEVQTALNKIRSKITSFCSGRREPTLVAVSKTKPPFMLQAAFDIGQRHFGENYVQELCSKHGELPREIQWHFIGHLQSNKCKSIVEIPNLYVVETVDSEKLAKQLQKACLSVGRADTLRVMVQVNTSDEESKYGCEPKDAVAIAKCIAEQCPNLKLAGLMTIGKLAGDPAPCFQTLLDCHQQVAETLKLNAEELELSMGMSGDMEQAITMGSTNVRVGSAIFGHRDYGIKVKEDSDDEAKK